ncbi:MAG: type II toxin-antitoxin system VapC family toxin [Balneolales bacterium]
MEKLVLDTNVIINLVRGNHIAQKVKDFVDSKETPQLFISVVSIAETESLVVQWGWGERKVNTLRKMIGSFVCIDIASEQRELIDAYVAVDAFSQGKKPAPNGEELNNSSRNMGKNDLWIASIAYALEAELLTTDDDFDHLNKRWITVKKFQR